MKYEHLSYVQDNKDIIYQVYGLIQPKGEVLVQISYVPLKFVKEEHLEMCKTQIINGEIFVKWAPLVDVIGLEKYSESSQNMINYIRISKFSKQLMELDHEHVKNYYPPIKIEDLDLDENTIKIIKHILDEFNLKINDVRLGGLMKFTLFKHENELLDYLVKSDLDIYVYSKEKSQNVKQKLRDLRENHPRRFLVERGLTGEIIPHRVLCSYNEYLFDIDFLFSPNSNELNALFAELSNDYEDIKFIKDVNQIDLSINQDSEGYSFPQLFKIDSQEDGTEILISYAHRYDFIFNGKININNLKLMKIKDKNFFIIDKYGSLNGEQTEALKI